MNLRIANVIVSGKAASEIDIEQLSNSLPHCVYEPEQFPGLVYRRLDPKCTIIMFRSGKITSIGSKSENLARQSILLTLREIGVDGRLRQSIRTENVVAVGETGIQINMNAAVVALQGAYFHKTKIVLREADATTFIFRNGKILTAGCKSERHARLVVSRTLRKLIASNNAALSRLGNREQLRKMDDPQVAVPAC
jgi:TATA-box binding protein (TBP) (component of TFIID and TFIIIB)